MRIRGFVPGTLIALLAGIAVGSALAAPPVQIAPFWPETQPLQVQGYDFWRVWETRCEVRQSPTTVYNLLDRHAVMNMWIGQLLTEKMPVDDVAPRSRVATVGRTMLAGDIARASREVDAIFAGLEGMAAGKEYIRGVGSVEGLVVDGAGVPVEGASIVLFGTPLGARTGANGRFRIDNVPCTTPRYIVQVTKQGFVDGYAGDIGPEPDRPGEAVVLLEKSSPENGYRTERLAVQVCRVVEVLQVSEMAAPLESAVIDVKKYPKEVLPYMKASANIDSGDELVKVTAQAVLQSVPEADRLRSTVVAKAVYAWIVRNVEHDLTRTYSDDPTSGNWQTTFGAWGSNFDDWCYLPSEVITHRRAICIEYERLAAALLRALQIPARPAPVGAHPVCQWWVQLPTGNGYWANMETSEGRTEFLRTGSMDAKFPSVGDSEITFWPVDERAPIHMSWDAAKPCLWREDYGQRARAPRTAVGLKMTQRWMEHFAERGRIPGGVQRQPVPTALRQISAYEVSTRGVVIDLASMGVQRKLAFRFPVFRANQYRTPIDMKHWTNHPEWVASVGRVKEQNEFTTESLEWYVVEFELGKKPEPAEAPPADTAPAPAPPAG